MNTESKKMISFDDKVLVSLQLFGELVRHFPADRIPDIEDLLGTCDGKAYQILVLEMGFAPTERKDEMDEFRNHNNDRRND